MQAQQADTRACILNSRTPPALGKVSDAPALKYPSSSLPKGIVVVFACLRASIPSSGNNISVFLWGAPSLLSGGQVPWVGGEGWYQPLIR